MSEPRKRRRPAYSCLECRRRKVRCDRNQPCAQCTAHGASCVFDQPPNRADSPPAQEKPQNDSNVPIHGTVSKTRVFGPGHWMSTVLSDEPYRGPLAACQEIYEEPPEDLARTVAQCKQLARDIKNQRPSRSCLPADLHRSVPDRPVLDELLHRYTLSFESSYRILHVPSLHDDYQAFIDHPDGVCSAILVQLLLVLAVAGPLHDDPEVRRDMATKARFWIHWAQTWLSAPLEKDRLTIQGLQIHCLLLLARQVHRVGADLVWISAGSLVRMAMQMGLHQDPSNLGEHRMRPAELRRRLWYTILEMNVQAALDAGMAPMISESDYNTQLPSNVDDDQLDESTPSGDTSSEPSFQGLLARSLPRRLESVRFMNRLQEEPSYDQVLRLGHELDDVCRDAATAMEQMVISTDRQFAASHCIHLLRRFPLCLHLSYAARVSQNPLYSYSHKVCLDATVDLVSLLDDELYHRLLLSGGGMFRDIITRGALCIFMELGTHLEADSLNFARKRTRARQEPLLRDARRIVQYARDRMLHGETNIKGYLFLSMAMAHIEALLDGKPPREAAVAAAHQSLETCHSILHTVADETETSQQMGLELWSQGIESTQGVLETDFDFLEHLNLDRLGWTGWAEWTGTLE
ncbi:hypothetical protein EYZ11_002274 [Aspergillus tanneri]|uniref:Zn(2)-C6 fungal-type domain-containing protein n=1 Tax=Aspergillus tanneri TaxID=1220188 RepID=A0A4S3JRC5_9EURO|nr:hypothetical protein EYZ11_002274 [Aspergillus tanneri]